MMIDDPRHGTEAGHEQHVREGEESCDSCNQAKLIASRRRTKRKAQGYIYTLPAGPMWDRMQDWRAAGASLQDISLHTGLEGSQVYEILNGDRDRRIYTRTWNLIAKAPTAVPLTSLGTTRRVQALMWLGYSAREIARQAGVHVDTITGARQPRAFVVLRVRVAVADTYQRLHMRLPVGETRQQTAGISRTRNYARAQGWVAPLAWDHIDDARERPAGWEYKPTARAELLIELDEGGAGISQVTAELGISRDALEKWCARHDLSSTFSELVARENRHRPPVINQYTAAS